MTDKPDLWTFCPECGTTEVHYEEGRHHFCRCGQEWFSDLNYSGVISANLGKWISERDEWKARAEKVEAERDAALAELATFKAACTHRRYTESPNGRVRQCRDCFKSWDVRVGNEDD